MGEADLFGVFMAENLFAEEVQGGPQIVPAGNHSAVLMDLKTGVGKGFGARPNRPTLTFVFQLESGGGLITRTVTRSRDVRSKLVDLTRSMVGDAISEEIISNRERFSQLLNSLIGKKFSINVATASNGRFSNILAVTPIRE